MMNTTAGWFVRNLLWFDGGAALLVGVVSWLGQGVFPELYQLPVSLWRTMGLANLLYGCYSLTLASRRRRPLAFIVFLVLANAAWACFCGVQFLLQASSTNVLGRAHLAFEGLFVGGLAWLEWRNRGVLAR